MAYQSASLWASTCHWIIVLLTTFIWTCEPTVGVTIAPATNCPPGTFANCSVQCHCLTVDACVSFGCSDYQCDRGWTGSPACQTACDGNHWDSGCTGVCYCLQPNTCNRVNGFCSSGCDPNHGGTSCQIGLPQLLSSPVVTNVSCSDLYVSWFSWSSTTGTGNGYPNIPLNVTSYRIEQRVNNSLTGNSPWEFVQSVTSRFPQPTQYTQVVNVTNKYNYVEYRIVCYWDDFGKSQPGLPSSASPVTRPATECAVSTVTSPMPTTTSKMSPSPQQTTNIATTTVLVSTSQNPGTTTVIPPTTTPTPVTTPSITPTLSATTPSSTMPPVQTTSIVSPSTTAMTTAVSSSQSWTTYRQDVSTVPLIPLPPAPTGLTAVGMTFNTISITWQAPVMFIGHVIQYSIIYSVQGVSNRFQQIYVNGSVTSWQITDLSPATNYVVQVQGQSEAPANGGWGNRSIPVIIRTADGFPTAPTNLQVANKNMTCMNVTWALPLTTNGVITNYKITFTANSRPDLSSGERIVASTVYQTSLCDLNPGVQYSIQVTASTSLGWGPPISIDAWTEICAPESPPRPVVNSTAWQTINIIIQPVILQCGPVSGYFIAVSVTSSNGTAAGLRRRRSSLPDPVQFIPLSATTVAQLAASDVRLARPFTVGDGKVYNGYQNTPLNQDSYYYIYYIIVSSLDGITKMAYSQSISPVRPIIFGAESSTAPTPTIPAITTGGATAVASELSEAAKIGIGVGVALAVLLLIALLILLLYCCCCKKRNQDAPGDARMNSSWLQYYTNTFGNPNSKWTTIGAIDEPRMVQIEDEVPSDLQVTDMHHSRPVISFADEFKMLPVGMTFPCSVAQSPENAELNRFPHLLAYDHSRVVLGSANSYVNANYMQGYDRRRKAYIAAQSPFNQQTICDFWLMVYQEHVTQVVFLAHLVEDSIVKCEQYWYDDDVPHTFGEIIVTLIKIEPYANFIVRTFELSQEGRTADKRLVCQYHFLSWPEHGVPGDPLTLLEFQTKVRSKISNRVSSDISPLLVHCGTGVSRTGVFVAVDYSLMKAKEENCVNVYRCCSAMRQCRPMMVRTLKQYIFIYDVLFEALLTHHSIVGKDINVNYRMLNRVNPRTNHSYFHEQFKVLEKFTDLPSVDACAVGISDANKIKNRFTTLRLLSRDQDRPVLKGPLVSNNYINAVYIDSYKQRRAFIITQTPLKNTLDEFLHLLYEFNVNCVVAVNGSDYVEDTCVKYWPVQDGQTMHTPTGINVTLRQTTNIDHMTVRKLELRNENSANDAVPRLVTQIQFQSWKMYDQVPWSREGFIKLLEAVQQVLRSASNNARNTRVLPPVVVHCVDGSSQSGLFCAVWNICEKMKFEQEVDIFHTVKAIKMKRFHCINSMAQYKFCFKLLWDYINTGLKQ